MNPPSSTLQEKIARLRASFIAQLPKRLDTAQQQFKLLKADPCMNRVAAIDLHRAFHSLKGTGHSFGFNELAAIAGEAEDYIQQLLDLPDDKTPPDWPDRLIGLLQELASQAQILIYTDLNNDHPLQTPFFDLNDQPSPAPAQKSQQRLVYLCDDELDQVVHLSYQLGCFGYQVEHFTTLENFNQAVTAKRPDAVVMDVRFPQGGTAGTDNLACIQNVTGQQLPAIVLSGRDDFEARLSAVRAGCQSYFTKPANPLDLARALDEAMSPEVPEPYRILIVDDEPEVTQYHTMILEEAGMLVYQLSRPEQVLAALQEFRPDLVLIDFYMPNCTGKELSMVIRQLPEYLSLPIVYLSSETDRQKQFTAMQAGVEGFITKPVVPDELVTAVALRAERMRSLRSLMVRDSLTGLYNHTTTTEMIDAALAQAKRQEESLCMVMLDLDQFKQVNDSYGHLAGDQVLVALARVLRYRLRTNDVVGRYGGEEFALLLRNVDAQTALHLVNQLREDFSQLRFNSGDKNFYCTFSAGVSCFPALNSTEELRIAADQALYQAKHSGRNQVVLAEAGYGE